MANVKKKEPTLTINDKSYDIAKLSDKARQQMMNVQLVDNEIQRLEMQLAIVRTARTAYQQALVAALPK
jgi:hypothetical protein